jgi:ApeA N-terminal domain 1
MAFSMWLALIAARENAPGSVSGSQRTLLVVRPSKLQQALEAGETMRGLFWPAGAAFQTPGVLTWSDEGGARLQLAALDDPWPTDFNRQFTVHAFLYQFGGQPLTLMHCRIVQKLNLDQPARIAGQTLAIGAHTDVDERWPVADYCPSALHESYPETGMSPPELTQGERPNLRFEWQQPEPLTIVVPGATLRLNPGMVEQLTWSWGPTWQIDTSMHFTVEPDEPLTIDEYWPQYRSPLLGFLRFAADRPEDMAWEAFSNHDKNQRVIAVLREGRDVREREWRPNVGHFLFKAEDIDSEADVLSRWFGIWRQTEPALGYLGDYIEEGNAYSPQRFLTLYTAAEEYWRKATGESGRNLRKLRARAGINDAVSHSDNDALALMGRLREYHAHLGSPDLSPDEITDGTFDSTRRLYVQMQACLLRDVGLDTDRIEELITLHYQSWPVP